MAALDAATALLELASVARVDGIAMASHPVADAQDIQGAPEAQDAPDPAPDPGLDLASDPLLDAPIAAAGADTSEDLAVRYKDYLDSSSEEHSDATYTFTV